MQTTIKKSSDTKVKKEKLSKEEAPKPQDVKHKKTSYSTPRNYIQKSSTADIYGQNKNDSIPMTKAPKKIPSTNKKTTNESPMKGLLKSTPSSSSVISTNREKTKMAVQKKNEAKATLHSAKVKDFNVIVNSPVVKKRLNLNKEKSLVKEISKKEKSPAVISSVKIESQKDTSNVGSERQRTKTRTLQEDEVKILTPKIVNNNMEMLNLSRKLSAAPKAYFIDLEDSKPTQNEQPPQPKTPSDEEISYEDDFESYESDFESYHSSLPSDQNGSDDKSEESSEEKKEEEGDGAVIVADVNSKEVRDEEKMLDSGSFDLRDQRSATKSKPVLDFILETTEEGKRSSLTDEGFLEMSSSSAVSSIRTVHIDAVERPLFIDFTKSQESKRKRKINERLKQRANDLLSVITLHEMYYSLFEMKPISYDLYMATFGKSNYQQVAVQTFDDGIAEDIQTEEIEIEDKWTQHPVDFSEKDICISRTICERRFSRSTEDYLAKFTFLTKVNLDAKSNKEININENYKTDALRIYFEQKDGVGPSEMLPYEVYKTKLKNNGYNIHRLGKFLKKFERKIINILNFNSGDTDLTELKMSNLSFSKGYISISAKNITDSKIAFLSNTKICKAYFSENKNNLILTVHNTLDTEIKKCIICLWDISVSRREPIKILIAIDNVSIGRFKGATDGFFVAALEDGSIHLWDLSEQPTLRFDVTSGDKGKEFGEIIQKEFTPFQKDTDLNKLNNHVGIEDGSIHCPLQACAFTNSALNMINADACSSVVGLEFAGDQIISQEGRKVICQVAALHRLGILTVWSIIQEKSKNIPPDIGKAFWSKMKLEKNQTINLLYHIDNPIRDSQNSEFNLNAAKRRILNRKQEKNMLKSNYSRPKLAFDIDRPGSAASGKNKKVLPVEKDVGSNWKTGVVCYDLKVVLWRNSDSYLIARNCGEVLCCRRILGVIRVNRINVTTDVSSVTCLEASPHRLPYYLAATDSGIISVCSLNENRILLTLDCRNIPTQEVEKYRSDHKGRYISSSTSRSPGSSDTQMEAKMRVTSLSWSHINPCCIFATIAGSVVCWDLTYSDIYAKSASRDTAISCTAVDANMALLTPEGDIHVHKLTDEHKHKEYLTLFEKYISLL